MMMMTNHQCALQEQTAASAPPPAPKPVSMKEWTVGVVDFLRSKTEGNGNNDGNNKQNLDKIVCSHEYLSCALKIAHSLADQLSAVEEERGYKEKSRSRSQRGSNNNPPEIDTALDKSWSGYISVYCVNRAMDEEKKDEIIVNKNKNDTANEGHTSLDADFEPLPYKGGDDSEPEDLQDLAQQLSTLFDNDDNLSIDYLNVRGAILNEKAVNGRPISDNGKLDIRSLGVAFYELFSGGQQIAAEAVPAPLSNSSTRFSSLPNRSPSLPLGQTAVELCPRSDEVEFESAMELIDTLDGGGGDELFPLTDAIEGGGSDINIGSKNDDGSESTLDDMSALGVNGESVNKPTKRRSLGTLPQQMMVRMPSASVAVEPLKLLGLPTALCDLVSNMIDSVNGDAHGTGEAYEFMSQVRDDLKLMVDSPNVYLRDVDLAKAASVGLQFGNSLYGREEELLKLKECYQRSISSEFEVAMICGASGVGKSKLALEFARSVNRDGGSIFLYGRFDRLQSQPLHAISSAFDKYCAWLTAKDHSTAAKVASALKENLGEEMASLVTAMPNLTNILGDDFDSKKSNESDIAVDAQKRLRYLFCQFVEVILSCQKEHLILFLDDCQWIDDASAALLIELMMSGSSIKGYRLFFFLGCRDDEISEAIPLNLVLSSLSSFGTKMTNIFLTSMSISAVNEMVSSTLSLLPRITRPLANILHHKTKGSPLFLKQLMVELCKEQLLYPSLSSRRWVWEADKIDDMKISEDVATFITKSLNRLPPEVLSALVVLSCFGANADISLIEVLEREIQQSLIAPLEAAVADSVLGKKNGEFYFMHDKLQEAAYSMMRPEERCLHHNRYGLALGFVAVRENDDKLLLTAVGQINHGGKEAVIDDEQAVVVANLNLDAGKKAMNMSDFFSAYSFFNHGISYLPRGHWNEHYDVSLELFNLAASCALRIAEYDRVKMLTGEIMFYAKCFEDQFRPISISITLLLFSSNVPEAMNRIHTTLSSLGEELPVVITQPVIEHYVKNTKLQLAGLSDDTLLSYPVMTTPSKIMAMELLSKQFANLTFVGDRASMPIVPLKMIQISLTYGMSPLSPVGFALYGNYLALARGEVEEGYRYVKFSLSLMKRLHSTAHESEILFYSTHTKVRVEPIQSSIEYYTDAYKAAMATGSTRSAIECSFLYDNCSFWSGKKLDVVVDSMNETMKQMNFYKHLVLLALILPIYRIALRLNGQPDTHEDDDLTNSFDETNNEDDITSKLPMHMLTTCFVKFYEGLVFREFDEARDYVQKYISIQSLTTVNMCNPGDFFRIFYAGLASFWVGRELLDKELIKRGVECKDKIEKLAASASVWNFQNKTYLLQAEEQFSEGNFQAAETLYDAAILSSKTHKFVNEEALANELAGHFYLETGRRNRSVHYFSRAFEKYNEWGAAAKAATLTKYLDESGDATI